MKKNNYYSNPKYVWLEKDISQVEKKSMKIKDLYPEKDLDPQNVLPIVPSPPKDSGLLYKKDLEETLKPIVSKIFTEWKKNMVEKKNTQNSEIFYSEENDEKENRKDFVKDKKKLKLNRHFTKETRAKEKKKIPFWVPLVLGIQGTIIFFLCILLIIFIYKK